MSYGIESKKLKKLVDYYSPLNNGQQIKFLGFFKGDQGLLRYLETSPFQGIDSASTEQRKIWFGSNDPISSTVNRNLRQIILAPIEYFGIKLHLFISILSLIINFSTNPQPNNLSWLASIINICVLILVIILLLVPELYQQYDNAKIKDFLAQGCKVKVWRNNQKIEIHSFDLVVGDIVQLEKGDIVGADGLIIQGNIFVKEPMNYKELVVQKNTTKRCTRAWAQYQQKLNNFSIEESQEFMPSPIVLGGSQIVKGQARLVVLCVGKFSRVGYFIHQVHRSATQRRSEIENKIHSIVFQISKYQVLSILCFIFLYTCKIVLFLILKQNFLTQNWLRIFIDLGYGLTVVLLGIPVTQMVGLVMGLIFIKLKIAKIDKIKFKYAKDCAKMKDITSIVFDKIQQTFPIKLIKWWNLQQEEIVQGTASTEHYKIMNKQFQEKFVKSLKCEDFQPYEVGLKIPSFFVGLNYRFVSVLQKNLCQFADQRTQLISKVNFSNQQISQIKIIESQSQSQKQKQIIYLKGNSQSLLKQCTHMLTKDSGRVIQINAQMREQILQIIWKMNAAQQPSLITGYIQVHPSHPKFRQPNYKIVMLSLISYRQNHDNEEFQSLARMRKMGISVTLMGNHSHEQTVSLSKEMGIVMIDKPSIRLRGYDFNKIVGGIICKNCKKSICICSSVGKFVPCLKNQDQFTRIYKHLNVLSQANGIQKMTLAIGFASAQQKTCFFGKNINDVPAMRISNLCIATKHQMQDQYVKAAAEVILPDNRLITLEKMIAWSIFCHQFCRKYLIFVLTPCFVAFISSAINFLLYNNFSINLLQSLWVSLVICPILGLTFALEPAPSLQNFQPELIKRDQPIFDKIASRQLTSQIIVQTALIVFIMVLGPSFIPEDTDNVDAIVGDDWWAKYQNDGKTTVCSGASDDIFDSRKELYSKVIHQYGIYSRHLTFVFNMFVIMQFINYFNCRNLSKSLNFVDGFTISMFLCLAISITLHVLIIFTGSHIFGLYPNGLTLKQWAICFGLSLIVILTGLLSKQIPYQNEKDEQKFKIWPNRCYNLAVMATVTRQSLQDFQIDEQLQVRKMALANE